KPSRPTQVKFNDLWRSAIKVAIPDPCRSCPHVDKARPSHPLTAIGKPAEINFLKAFKFGTPGLIRYALVLHRTLVTIDPAPDDERDLWITSEVPDFSCYVQRIEENLEIVGHYDPDEGRLRSTGL